MASTNFVSGTVVTKEWLNDANAVVYNAASGTPGASTRTLVSKLADTLSVKDFGAKGDGVTDDTAAIQAAITYAANGLQSSLWFTTNNYTTPRVVDFPSATYKINGKLLLPNAVVLRGNQSTLLGTGNTVSDNIAIESAYFLNGVLTSNIGTSAETQRLQFTRVEGFKFSTFKQALNLYDCNEGCRFSDLTFYNCYQPVIADRCFYTQFSNWQCKEVGALGVSAVAAYDFRNFVNVELMENLSVINRKLGMSFSGGVNGLALRNCTVENGTAGIVFTGNVNPMNIDSCYFENLTGIALDFTAGGGTSAITIDNNYFFSCGTGISGNNMLGGRIGRGNFFNTVTNKVIINDVVSTIKVELPFTRGSDVSTDGRPALLSGYTLGGGIWAEQPTQVYFNATGGTLAQQNYNSGFIPLPFSGTQGYVPARVAFCSTSLSGSGASVSMFIDTKIAYDLYAMGVYSLLLTDNTSTYTINGRFYANGNVCTSDSAGKPIAVSNNGGFVRLTITTVNAPGGTAGLEGVVRMY